MKSSSGLTLIEVLIAIVVLAVGVLAAASLQTNALRASSTARVIQEVTNTARTEIERQRQLRRPLASAATCASTPAGYTCTGTEVPCRLQSDKTVLCAASGSGFIVADQVTVTVVGPQARTVQLRTVVVRPL